MITSAVTTVYAILMLQLITGLDDPVVDAMLRAYDWYILLIMNPDGYIYSWDTVSAMYMYMYY